LHVEITNEDIFITFFKTKGTVHCEYIPQSQSVGQAYYMEIMKQLCEAVCRKRSKFQLNDWILHYNNAPAHKALFCQAISGPKINY